MKKTAAILCAAILLALTACGNKLEQIGRADSLELADFNIYADGQVALGLQETPAGSFLFAWADMYELETTNVQTRRGVALEQSDYEIVKQYGEIPCQIDYKMNGHWETLYDITFLDYYGSTLYTKEYNVTFYAFVRGGRLTQMEDVETFVSLNIGTGGPMQVYGLTFCVNGGVIRNIESYTYTSD